jgi:signal transduction histidine kinase
LNSRRPHPLKHLLLVHELIFVLLVMLAGAAGWASIHKWQNASAESQRINTLIQEVQQTRGDLYRQMKELFDAIFLQDPLALEEYTHFSRRAEQHFVELRTYATGDEELRAIDELQASYEDFKNATLLLLEPPKRLSTRQLRKSLDTELEAGILTRYEAAAAQTEVLLADKQQQLREQLQKSKITALTLFSIPVALAGALLLFSHVFLQRAIVRPIDDVLHATTEISAGRLEYQVPQAGTAELSDLAQAINHMAEALKHSQEALARSQKQAAQGALVPMLAHNIRNPLASIRAIAQVADDPQMDQETREALRDIIGTVDRLERWTGALLAYLLPMKPHLAVTSLQAIISGALAPLQTRLREKSIKVELPATAIPIRLNTDESLMEQTLYNLLLNAIDASPTDSSIKISVESDPDVLQLRIQDHGPGMPFAPHPSGLSPGPSTKRFGTGLGIPFAFKVCEALGYQLDFESGPEGGTCVSMRFPRSA